MLVQLRKVLPLHREKIQLTSKFVRTFLKGVRMSFWQAPVSFKAQLGQRADEIPLAGPPVDKYSEAQGIVYWEVQ